MGVCSGGSRLRIWHYRTISTFSQNWWKGNYQEIKWLMVNGSHWKNSKEVQIFLKNV